MRNLGVAEDHELRWLFGNVPRLIPRLIALYWLMYDMWTNYPLCTYVCYMNELLLYIHFIFPKMCFIPISSPFRTATYLALFFEDHTSHLASRLSSMERDAKAAAVNGGEEEWLPRGKNHMANKKGDNNYWTSRLFIFFEPFFNVHFFWAGGFSNISNGRFLIMAFSKPWKFVPLRWCEAQLASLQPMIQESWSRFFWIVAGK